MLGGIFPTHAKGEPQLRRPSLCLSKSGEPFWCHCTPQNICEKIDSPESTQTTPVPGTPFVLPPESQETYLKQWEERKALTSECQSFQFQTLQPNFVPPPDLEPKLWKLVSCLKIELDTAYESEKESHLRAKLHQVLSLLAKYPTSRNKAYRELGDLAEAQGEYDKALDYYQQVSVAVDPTVLADQGRALCHRDQPNKSPRGLQLYIQAIEKQALTWEPTTAAAQNTLTTLLEQCGYTHLVPLLQQEKDLITNGQMQVPVAVAFLRKHTNTVILRPKGPKDPGMTRRNSSPGL